MKLLIYCPGLSYKRGGAETFVRLLTQKFIERGDPECILFVAKGFSEDFEKFYHRLNGHLQVYSFPCLKSDGGILSTLKRWMPSIPFYRRFFSSQYEWDFESLSFKLFSRRALRTFDFDVLSVQYYMDLAFLKTDRPVAFHFQGIHPFPGATRILKKRTTGFVACSNYIQNQVLQFHKIDAEVIHNPVDCSFFKPNAEGKERSYDVLFAGRLYPNKGIKTLLTLAGIMENIRFGVAGDGPLAGEVKKAERRLKNVVYLGPKQYEEMPSVYQDAKMLICPSRSDPFPLVTLEAMASGLPVVASHVGGIPEAVDHRVGRLVDPEDTAGFKREISNLLGNSNLRNDLGEAGRRRCLERFSIEKIASQVLNFYTSLLRRG